MSERLLGGKTHSVAENHMVEVERVKDKLKLNAKLVEVFGEIRGPAPLGRLPGRTEDLQPCG